MRLFEWVVPLLLGSITIQKTYAKSNEYQPEVNKIKTKSTLKISPFDDSTTLLRIEDNHLVISEDNGATWNNVKDVKDEISWIEIDPFNNKGRAFVTVKGEINYYMTNNMGKKWTHLNINGPKDKEPVICDLKTHPFKQEYLMVSCVLCPRHEKGDIPDYQNCDSFVTVSKDQGKSFNEVNLPGKDKKKHSDNHDQFSIFKATSCEFAKINKDSKLAIDDSTIICNEFQEALSDEEDHDHMAPIFDMNSKLYYTNDFGKNVQEFDKFKDMTVSSFRVLESYIVVITQDDSHNKFSPRRIWVSNDAKSFTEAYVPSQIRYETTGFMFEDNLGRIILPISRSNENDNNDNNDKHNRRKQKKTFSEVYISDSTGTKFSLLDSTTSRGHGMTLYSPIEFLKGTSILRKMSSFLPRHDGDSKKMRKHFKQITKITTDNGHTWNNLRIIDPGNEDKYPCDINDVEKCFLSPFVYNDDDFDPTVGILLLTGSVSDGTNADFSKQSTFLSRDGGTTWKEIFNYPTATVTGDYGNIIIAMPFDPEKDDDPASEFYFSLDQGFTWHEYQFEESMIPMEVLPVTQDGSGSKFMISGISMDQADGPGNPFGSNLVYAIDFSTAFNGKQCQDSDFEKWAINNYECVTGSKYTTKRRKKDAECLVKNVYQDLTWDEETCDQCTEADYECAFEFSRDANKKCVPDINLMKLSGKCVNDKKKTLSLSPLKLIPGDKCKKPMKIDNVPFKCSEDTAPVKSGGPIVATENKFDNEFAFYQYFNSVEDETVIFVDRYGKPYISHDSGQTIQNIETDGEAIQEVVFNPHFNSSAFLFGRKGSLFVTHDRGHTFTSTELPEARQLGFPLDFNFKEKDSFIFYGGKNCENPLYPECHAVAYITRDGGKTFKELLNNSIHCEFAGSQYVHPVDEDLIICQVRDNTSIKRSLISSTDDFKNEKKVLYDDIIGYMSGDGYSVVAVSREGKELRAFVTQDGEEFAEAKLPQDLADLKQQTFTILGSQMLSIFMHMSTNNKIDYFFGDLLKSNSNGTSFVTLQKDVNRNNKGLVDFEVVQNLEGIILINVVANAKDVSENSQEKNLKTKITFNDGSDWTYLKPPQKDSEGKKYSCNSKDLEHCSLNLHGSSEYIDTRDTYSSGSAVGMMFAIGNVGESLLPRDQCSTFFTSDGGMTWKEVKKGANQWEFGDHGGVLVLVAEDKVTNYVTYSLDAGVTWKDFIFTQENVMIKDIVTVPQDSALRFLLITEATDVSGQYTKTYTIDFFNSFKRQCVFDLNKPDHDDFDYARIVQSKEECLFGHKGEFLKKIHNDCFIGNIPMSNFFRITENCTCSRQDFECDYNYYKAKDGTCKLVEGLSPQAPEDVCKLDDDLIEFSEPTGYRKIPLSTCQGGLTLDVTRDKYPCPGKEKEFKSKYGVSGSSFLQIFSFFFIVFMVFGYVVYDRGIRRNGGFARFGEIRLGDEEELVENNLLDKFINSVVKSGLMAASGIYTGVQLAKRFFSGSFRNMSNRFSSRRGPSYSTLINDQFLDDADDLLAGHDEDADDLASFIDHDSNFDIDDDETTQPPAQGYRDHVDEPETNNDAEVPANDPQNDTSSPDDNSNS